MNTEHEVQRVVLKGTWLYAGTVPSPVRIIEQHFDFWCEIARVDGTSEEDEKPELNKDGLLYYVIFRACEETATPWWVDSPGFVSIELARAHAQTRVEGQIEWD